MQILGGTDSCYRTYRFLSFRTDDNFAIIGSGFSSTGSMKCRLRMYVSLVICVREVNSLLPHALITF